MTEYYSLMNASLGIQVRPITIRRWIENGWLDWPKPYRQHPQDHDKLLAIKRGNDARKRRGASERFKARRKYFTEDAVMMGRYLSVKRFRQNHRATVIVEDRQHKALKRHPCFQMMKAEMLEFYGPKCIACGKRKSTCMDHIHPLGQNGENHPTNLQPLCIPCNTAKAGKDTDYRHDRGRWLAIRWGGWVVNGANSRIGHARGRHYGSELRHGRPEERMSINAAKMQEGEAKGLGKGLGSKGDGTFITRHFLAVELWRKARIHAGAHCSPAEYKSFVIKNPPRNTWTMTDAEWANSLACMNAPDKR